MKNRVPAYIKLMFNTEKSAEILQMIVITTTWTLQIIQLKSVCYIFQILKGFK